MLFRCCGIIRRVIFMRDVSGFAYFCTFVGMLMAPFSETHDLWQYMLKPNQTKPKQTVRINTTLVLKVETGHLNIDQEDKT